MIKKFYLYFIISAFNSFGQLSLLDSLLNNLPSHTRNILKQANNYRIQIIYTKINYSESGQVHFEEYFFNYSDTIYNYPASMVKLPASIVALKKISTLHPNGIDWNSKILMDSLFCQKALLTDSIGMPTYPHLQKWIKRMLIISDNDAYTHTYDFINCKTLHQWLYYWGFDKAQIKHKFIAKCINDSTYYTPTVYILNEKQDTLYIQYQDSACKFPILNKNYNIGYTIKTIKQKRKRHRIKEPKIFIKHNDWPLLYSHQLLKFLIFDEELKILNLPKDYRDSIIKFMGSYPREYPELQVDTTSYYDTWKKFFIYGSKYKRITEDTLRSINIIGRAYGFLSETAYIVDFKNNIDFILSASIYVNPNDLMDGKYNYETAYYLFYQISRLIYNYEKTRVKTSNKIHYYEHLFKNRK